MKKIGSLKKQIDRLAKLIVKQRDDELAFRGNP